MISLIFIMCFSKLFYLLNPYRINGCSILLIQQKYDEMVKHSVCEIFLLLVDFQ